MNKNKFIISVLVLIIIGGVLFYFYTDKKNKKSDKSNSNISITSNSNSNTTNNSNIESNTNSNIESNSNSNIENNSNSNITSNYNSNKESNLNSNKPVSNFNSNKTSNSNPNSNTPSNPTSNKPVNNGLATNGSFSGIFQSDNHKVHMIQVGNKVHFYVYNRKTKSSVTIKGTVNGNTVTAGQYNIKFVLKTSGIEFTSSNKNLGNGYIPKIEEYTYTDYFEEFMHGNKNGLNGIYRNRYGTIKIYTVYKNSLSLTGEVFKKNANTDAERNTTIKAGKILDYKSSNFWASNEYPAHCDDVDHICDWISVQNNGNSITILSDSNSVSTLAFHIGKYFNKDKDREEPKANVYTKHSDYTIKQIVEDSFKD